VRHVKNRRWELRFSLNNTVSFCHLFFNATLEYFNLFKYRRSQPQLFASVLFFKNKFPRWYFHCVCLEKHRKVWWYISHAHLCFSPGRCTELPLLVWSASWATVLVYAFSRMSMLYTDESPKTSKYATVLSFQQKTILLPQQQRNIPDRRSQEFDSNPHLPPLWYVFCKEKKRPTLDHSVNAHLPYLIK